MTTPTARGHFGATLLTAGLAAAAAMFAIALVAFINSGGLLGDEWACEQGKAPATNEVGGSNCFDEGSTLPKGFTWDVGGNHRLP
ncbi:MAG TPA: hypothetical protein VLI04_00445 [Nocardioidaceae bacterium]|nr:hypothetical protein [Nocardioidaceae bacterium]